MIEGEYIKSYFHQIIAGIGLAILGKFGFCSGHKVNFLNHIFFVWIEPLKFYSGKFLLKSWGEVVGKKDSHCLP